MKKAFTLAEVLVTLGIIGVVSAMTLPTLVKNHQKKVLVTQLKSSYSILQNALEKMMLDSNATNMGETKFFRICTYDNILSDTGSGACSQYLKKEYFNSTSSGFGSAHSVEYISCQYNGDTDEYLGCTASNGGTRYSGLLINMSNGSLLVVNHVHSGCATFMIDVNGAEGPNVHGRDVFFFYTEGDSRGELVANDINGPGAKRIIEDGWEMNY